MPDSVEILKVTPPQSRDFGGLRLQFGVGGFFTRGGRYESRLARLDITH